MNDTKDGLLDGQIHVVAYRDIHAIQSQAWPLYVHAAII